MARRREGRLLERDSTVYMVTDKLSREVQSSLDLREQHIHPPVPPFEFYGARRMHNRL